ncbi:hypothetical protein CPC08DRAFT_705472 [Agrocybe pediades]|nr:hypothetical protein CPC08DRAFT_705472 [Agrocybe pediades]
MPPQPITVTNSTSSSHHQPSSDSYLEIQPRRGDVNRDGYNEYHRVEFEAPLSAEIEEGGVEKQQSLHLAAQQLAPHGRFSIDLSLELERELADMESPPVTPAYTTATMKTARDAGLEETGDPASSRKSHARTTSTRERHAHRSESFSSVVSGVASSELSPDPEILTHIVTQLRQSLADMTKERDDLVKMLAEANMREAETQDALQAMTDKATAAEEERSELKKKMKEDEEQIVMLRAKVEESRRGLMRLQTENRRQSMTPIDINRASAGPLSSFMSPPSSKRASFVPLTGSRPNGHRRISSVSDSFGTIPTPELTPSPNVHAFNIASAEAALSGRRTSGFYGRPAELDAPPSSVESSPGSSAAPATNSAELEQLRKELLALKDELQTAKHDLVEAKEAKEASETCVTALREFIAENSIGSGGAVSNIKLPPPPTMTTGQEELAESKKTGTGWGFKLWGNTTGVDSPLRSSAAVPQSAALPMASPMVNSSMNSPSSAVPIGAAPLSRKLGGFFSSKSSISSNHSREQSLPAPLHLPQLQTNAASSHRDSMHSYSDASSIAEPVSPGSDLHGPGTAGYAKTAAGGMVRGEEVMVHTHELTALDGTPVRVSVSAVDLDGLR